MPCRCCNQQADSVTPPTHRCYPLATECITARHPVCATCPSSARSVDRSNLLIKAVTGGLTNRACVENGDTNAECLGMVRDSPSSVNSCQDGLQHAVLLPHTGSCSSQWCCRQA